MYRVLVAACALGLVTGFEMEPNKWTRKYIKDKIYEDCVGKDVMDEVNMRVMAAHAKCQGDDVKLSTVMDALKERYQQAQQSMLVPVSMAMPQFLSGNMVNQQPLFRGKRQTAFTPELVMGIREKAISSMSILTCVLKEMNFMKDDNTPNVNYIKRVHRDLILDENLREDLDDVVDMCNSFSMCMPLDKSKNPAVQEHGRVLGYLKCENEQKMAACMKHNMRKELTKAAVMAGAPMPDEATLALGDVDGVDILFELMMFGTHPTVDMQ